MDGATFEWEDGSPDARRSVCIEEAAVALSVVALDAADARSAPQTIRLEVGADAGCPEPIEPADAGPAPELCRENPSFEGTPAADFVLAPVFDAEPWSVCTNPVRTNVPRIGNDTTSVTGSVPPPVDGLTYVALGEGDQVSQGLCSELPGGATLHLQLDLARIDLGAAAVPQTERVFLEIHGGLAEDCSTREMLWASPALEAGWQRSSEAGPFSTPRTISSPPSQVSSRARRCGRAGAIRASTASARAPRRSSARWAPSTRTS